jgi:hypothetical protein
MKIMFKILASIIILTLVGTSCSSQENPNWINANIKVEVATRGVHQYLLQFNDNLYYPENLPLSFQDPNLNGLAVRISYLPKKEEKDIFKPSPNDIPVKAYSVPVILILQIERR